MLFSIKKFKKDSKTILASFIILAVLSPVVICIHFYLPGILTFFDVGPAKHWPAVFITQRLDLSGYTIQRTEADKLFKPEPDLIKAEWNFKKPGGFRYVYSVKFTEKPVQFASFYYSRIKDAQNAFREYKKELELEFKKAQLNLSLDKTYNELTLYDSFTMVNDSIIVHSELLVREKSNNAAILVVMADKNEMDTLKNLLKING